MTDVAFYHLTRQAVDDALPKLLARVYGAGLRALVRVGSDERRDILDSALWTYDQDSFLPHGTAKTGRESEQPIYLSTGSENPNDATVLVLLDGLDADDLGDFDRCLYMFDGRSDEMTAQARAHWSAFRDAGHDVTYWQQGAEGGWEKKPN